MIANEVLGLLTQFLGSPSEEIIKLTLFALSNIAADSHLSADAVLKDETLIFRLLVLMESKSVVLRKECSWVLV
jgi:hypothetical protein